MKTKFDASLGCVMSFKWSHVRLNVAKLDIHYSIPTIQIGRNEHGESNASYR